MSCAAIRALPDDEIDRVIFFRRAEVEIDPVCCEVHSGHVVYYAHQEERDWLDMLERLERLPGFMKDWFATLTEPPFPRLEMIVYERKPGIVGEPGKKRRTALPED